MTFIFPDEEDTQVTKKPRLLATESKADDLDIPDDDFEISPPPSPKRNLTQKLTESFVGKKKHGRNDIQEEFAIDEELEIADRIRVASVRGPKRGENFKLFVKFE